MNSAKQLSAGVETLLRGALEYPHFRARVERARTAKRWRAAFARLPLSHTQAALALGIGSFRLSGIIDGARAPSIEETEQIERFLSGEKIEPLQPRKKPAPPRTAKVGARSAVWSERIARSGLPLTEIARRAGITEQRGSSILSRSAHLRGDEQQRLERVLGREEPVSSSKVSANVNEIYAPGQPELGGTARSSSLYLSVNETYTQVQAELGGASEVATNGSDSSVGSHSEPAKPLPAEWRDALRERGVFITRFARALSISRCRTRPLLAGRREPTPAECIIIAELLSA